ncbi:divalent metal cation transporter [Metarhizobium album]|uniref:divalent metal cation transporter n=1 Tax=Metarhizobium album TaxID=2182425 RepID=UPI00267F83D0
MLWTMLLTYPLMSVIQFASARIGRVTGCGLAVNMGAIWTKPLVVLLVRLLFIANCINIGANLAAMGASVELATGIPSLPITIGEAGVKFSLELSIASRVRSVCAALKEKLGSGWPRSSQSSWR